MNEKRFKLFVGKNYGVQTNDGEVIFKSITSIIEADVLVDLLNELHEENQRLQNKINELKLLNDGLNYALKYIRQIDVEIDIDS